MERWVGRMTRGRRPGQQPVCPMPGCTIKCTHDAAHCDLAPRGAILGWHSPNDDDQHADTTERLIADLREPRNHRQVRDRRRLSGVQLRRPAGARPAARQARSGGAVGPHHFERQCVRADDKDGTRRAGRIAYGHRAEGRMARRRARGDLRPRDGALLAENGPVNGMGLDVISFQDEEGTYLSLCGRGILQRGCDQRGCCCSWPGRHHAGRCDQQGGYQGECAVAPRPAAAPRVFRSAHRTRPAARDDGEEDRRRDRHRRHQELPHRVPWPGGSRRDDAHGHAATRAPRRSPSAPR